MEHFTPLDLNFVFDKNKTSEAFSSDNKNQHCVLNGMSSLFLVALWVWMPLIYYLETRHRKGQPKMEVFFCNVMGTH
jgi:hypothetical protein